MEEASVWTVDLRGSDFFQNPPACHLLKKSRQKGEGLAHASVSNGRGALAVSNVHSSHPASLKTEGSAGVQRQAWQAACTFCFLPVNTFLPAAGRERLTRHCRHRVNEKLLLGLEKARRVPEKHPEAGRRAPLGLSDEPSAGGRRTSKRKDKV